MENVTNPFIVQGAIPEAYFCDRVQETERLVRNLTNGNNTVLYAQRRIGKTKLIDHCFEQPQIKNSYYTIFVDIMQTSSLQEMTYELGKAVFNALSSVSHRMGQVFMQTVRSIRGDFSVDPLSGQPKFSFSLGHIDNPTYTLDEIFRVLEQADKPCIVAIDEFQRIALYPEKNVEAILRTHIQRMHNCRFIYSGSERHLLGQMFLDYNRPFYQSSAMMALDVIERSKYAAFAITHFEEFGKRITAENVNGVYDLFGGNTFAMHKTLNVAFSLTQKGEECTLDTLRKAIDEILDENDYDYRARLMSVSPSQKEVLYAIGRRGMASQITGTEFINTYRLASASSVQSAVRKLLENGWVAECSDDSGKKSYQLNDMFLMLWIQQRYGMGYTLKAAE